MPAKMPISEELYLPQGSHPKKTFKNLDEKIIETFEKKR